MEVKRELRTRERASSESRERVEKDSVTAVGEHRGEPRSLGDASGVAGTEDDTEDIVSLLSEAMLGLVCEAARGVVDCVEMET